jgi:hypothetical protein
VPAVPGDGVPARVPVPPPLSVNVSPWGGAADRDSPAFGYPAVVTVKVLALPSAKVVALGDEKAGGHRW